MPRYFIVLTLISLALLVGCSTSKHGSNPDYETINEVTKKAPKETVASDIREIQDIPQFEETDGLVAPGFLFSLNHPTDTKLQGTFRVQFDGVLKLPYGVKFSVLGLTFEQLKRKVLDAYGSFFQRGSQNVIFTLVSKDYWVEVRGYVKKSGSYLVKRKESIDKIIDMAGGLNGDLKEDFFIISIKQQNLAYSVSLNQYYENNVLGTKFTWTGGDVIFINQSHEDDMAKVAPTVDLIGGVVSPGKALFKKDANVFYYISKRGGVIANIGYGEAFVIRKTKEGLVRINFDLTEMDTIPVIKPGDTILINTERDSLFDKTLQRIAQFGSIITTIAFLIIAF